MNNNFIPRAITENFKSNKGDVMQWEKFTGQGVRSWAREPTITIVGNNKARRFYFNVPAVRKYGLHEFSYCELWFDRKSYTVGFLFNHDGKGFRVTKHSSGGKQVSVQAESFLKYYQLNKLVPGTKKKYPIENNPAVKNNYSGLFLTVPVNEASNE